MNSFAISPDGLKIFYEQWGDGPTALVFVSGWLGTTAWWESQVRHFEKNYLVICLDLAGHGRSEKDRKDWCGELFAEDIKAVLQRSPASNIILIGHSMAGAFVLKAAADLPKVKGIILVDTLKDMGNLLSFEKAEEMLLRRYRENFEEAVTSFLPNFLFSKETPLEVRNRLQSEFLAVEGKYAAQLIEPLYKMDIKKAAGLIKVPVRGISSRFTPTNVENNQKVFLDYDCTFMAEAGHYPMLEAPDEFNITLERVIDGIINSKIGK